MKTEELIIAMLKEITEMSLGDSGNHYGRNWQRNQKVDFEENQPVTVDTDWLKEGDQITVTIDLYHYLANYLYCDELTDEFNTKFGHMEYWDGKGYGLSEEASQWLEDQFEIDLNDLNWFNTYNGDDSLSQIIQGAYIGNNYVILQVHGGCDARCGYTDAKLFATYGYLDQTVYGTVTYQDGHQVQVDTAYNGYCLTNEVGEDVLYEPGMVFDLWIAEP